MIKIHLSLIQATNTVKAISKKHIISRGDTLSEIAHKYGVSMRAIKTANALNGGRILIGQVLKIPAGLKGNRGGSCINTVKGHKKFKI